MSEYDFEIKHIKGKENIVVDALSRQQHEIHFVLISDYEPEFKTLLKKESNSDEKYKNWMEKCNNGTVGTKEDLYQVDTEGFMHFKN